MDAVPLSFHIITLSSSFEDAIRLAISQGDDGDTCEKFHQKSSLTTLTMTTLTTIQNKQAHPLWSEPDCIRFFCHVSPELLVTSAVKSPLVRRKVRPWVVAASNWGSRARVAKAKRSPTAERTLLSMIPNGGLRNPPTRRRMERMSET